MEDHSVILFGVFAGLVGIVGLASIAAFLVLFVDWQAMGDALSGRKPDKS